MFDFRETFKQLTGNEPFDWQERLFHKFLAGEFPDACDIPTGLGKTHVMTIWLIALGCWMKQPSRKIPLRLVYVVDRRVIVDQATDEAERLQKKLTEAIAQETHPLHSLAQTFRNASMKGGESLLALSTLRGQRADNREWCLDPSRPAIIVGTVDMIGSRMLFTGYGKVGINHRSLQAGLLGQDSLIVIDEAHLSPCFVDTQRDIHSFVQQGQSLRPFHVMTLSATLGDDGNTLTFDEEKECQNEIAKLRLMARKQIEWLDQRVAAKNADKVTLSEIREAFAQRLVSHAIQYEASEENAQPQSIIVFAQTVELVNLVYDKLKAALEEKALASGEAPDRKTAQAGVDQRVLKMTGEMRGAERDDLTNYSEATEQDILRLLDSAEDKDHAKLIKILKFKRFSPNKRDRITPRAAHYLIATSCAEVGVNLDADHGLCDLSTLDSMIQRIGRINRFGHTASNISVIVDEKVLAETGKTLADLESQRKELTSDKAKKAFRKAQSEFEKGVAAHRVIPAKLFYTWQALKTKEGIDGKVNASPLALRGLLKGNEDALPAPPVRPPFESARLDDWAMTSLKQKEYPRPLVHYWLRGVIADEQAQTTFVWRSALDQVINAETLTNEELIEIATVIPIQPKERANLATFRGENLLKALAGKTPDRRIILADASGEAQVYSLQQLKDQNRLFELLAFATVILPGDLGGLDHDGNPLDKLPKVLEPVEDAFGASWTQYLITRHSSDSFTIRPFAQHRDEVANEPSYLTWQAAVRSIKDKGVCRNAEAIQKAFAQKTVKEEDNIKAEAKPYIAVFFDWKAEEESKESHEAERFLQDGDDEVASLAYPVDLTVERHNSDVGSKARLLAEKLGLPAEFVEAIAAAGFRHDLGKAREWWQKAIGNFDFNPSAKPDESNQPLAKSRPDIKSFDHDFNQGYRHEFGSLVESLEDAALQNHPHCDLILHLIAAHHGYARPHFPERAFDRQQPKPLNQQIAHETLLRFHRLQQQYGWWQLAYLEAVLKAADALASRAFSRGEFGGAQ